ncbi:hypothetical protein [Amycolatopsis tucumanensis]|uniref:hypothetical protein n=1 Tax=Amycolatopsis tucumanensis TaxID=401106 RepID=UPI003D72D806
MLATLSGAGEADGGAASGVVNTAVQLGLSAGPGTIGTAFFGRLPGHGIASAPQTGLLVGLGLCVVALPVGLLPAGVREPRAVR